MSVRFKYYLYFGILVVLLLPLLQFSTHLFKVEPLSGWYKTYDRPDFMSREWFTAEYQDAYTVYFENNFGFRPWFVKLRNQINYSLFHKVQAVAVEIGQDNYLFELNYIKAYNGLDYLGDSIICAKADSLALIKAWLSKQKVDLLVCFAAGKGSYYPEYFPKEYLNQKSDKSNYLTLKKNLLEKKINIIDFNQWFLDMKDTSRFSLYPKYGIHWSEYGAILAGDSLIHYIEKLRNADLPDLEIESIKNTNVLRGSDYDIGKSLNLIFQLPSQKMAYPKIKWSAQKKDTCRVIVISDSFYWQLYNMGWSTQVFTPGGFWYYNKVSYPGGIELKDIDYMHQLAHSDVIVLLATEATLDRFPYGFMRDFFLKSGLSVSP
jgi:hypothetical protein